MASCILLAVLRNFLTQTRPSSRQYLLATPMLDLELSGFRDKDGTVTKELHIRVVSWFGMYHDQEKDAQGKVREVVLEWAARIICILAEERELSLKEIYCSASQAMNLPWQQLARLALSL